MGRVVPRWALYPGVMLGAVLLAVGFALEGVARLLLIAPLFLVAAFLVARSSISHVSGRREIRALHDGVEELLNRQRRDTRTLANIAGTTGKMAPRVRAIETATAKNAASMPIGLVPTVGTKAIVAATPSAAELGPVAEYQIPDRESRRPDTNVMTILDEFSNLAFAPEWNQHRITPSTWLEVLDEHNIDLLFVESAWDGNEGAWLYHIVGETAPRPAFVALLEECKRRGVPTVFWNKEDPPHFEDFLETASLFDVVFTTDEDCVPEYINRLGHDRVYVLPFAAQTRIHNPARPPQVQRDREIAFGGMYFRHKYPERRAQLTAILPAASKLGLEIFSRHVGENENYMFPEQFQRNVIGSLSYKQMLTAYHKYKVFINVNSVVGSRSMCARRIFEVTAAGGAILSPSSPAIEHYFPGGLVAVADTEDEARNSFRALLGSDEYRERQVHKAQRVLWGEHTYTHRVSHVLERAGVRDDFSFDKSVSVIAPTIRPANVQNILHNVAKQSISNVELVLLTHGFTPEEAELRAEAAALGINNLKILQADRGVSLGSALNNMVAAASGDLVAKMDDDDFYGLNYLSDLRHAHFFSEAEIVGKAAAYIYFESFDATALNYGAHENRFTDFVRGATLFGARSVFLENPFEDRGVSEDSRFLKSIIASGGKIYASDRFNFVINRAASSDAHTWKVQDLQLFSGSRMFCTGRGETHVEI